MSFRVICTCGEPPKGSFPTEECSWVDFTKTTIAYFWQADETTVVPRDKRADGTASGHMGSSSSLWLVMWPSSEPGRAERAAAGCS